MDCEKNQVLWSVTKARWNGWGTWCRRLWHFGIYRSIEASVSLNMASWHRGILIYFFCQAQKYSIMSDGRSVRLALSVICVLIPALTSVFLDSARAYPSCQHRLVLRRIFTALFLQCCALLCGTITLLKCGMILTMFSAYELEIDWDCIPSIRFIQEWIFII